MAHGSCPKCGASVGGSSKTCGSCGAVRLPLTSFSAVQSNDDPDLPELSVTKHHLSEMREGGFEMRDEMTSDAEATMERGHRRLA
ncbi:hypothetical protein BDZ85DRAFT_83389 [Elsinoe ampelina]|uniref:Zinc-ribbon domain-containing protein n=1 Tax=Elsinoe ampelina TaxID=302913 RepID=A0A6A6GG63_9PEZI|nr:hypothetical protein BDZ85DRAFT_83389 [Elsinoe ampelina]